jgi:hypothetical protein
MPRDPGQVHEKGRELPPALKVHRLETLIQADPQEEEVELRRRNL